MKNVVASLEGGVIVDALNDAIDLCKGRLSMTDSLAAETQYREKVQKYKDALALIKSGEDALSADDSGVRHVSKGNLKSVIYLDADEFTRILAETGIDVEISLDGISYLSEDEDFEKDEIYGYLGEYFNVDVVSIHTDTAEYPGIWLTYRPVA